LSVGEKYKHEMRFFVSEQRRSRVPGQFCSSSLLELIPPRRLKCKNTNVSGGVFF
jgi:hypothetical protein